MGIGLSTLIGSCFRILTKLALPTDKVVSSSLLFFYSGALVIVLVTIFYKRLLALPCSEKYIVYGLSPHETKTRHNRVVQQAQELIFLKQDMCESSPLITAKCAHSSSTSVTYYSSESIPLVSKAGSSNNTTNRDSGSGGISGSSYEILLKIYPAYFPVVTVYSVTLLLWPPLVTEIHSFNFPLLEETQWWSLILLFVFALMDCVGRYDEGYCSYHFACRDVHVLALWLSIMFVSYVICMYKYSCKYEYGWMY